MLVCTLRHEIYNSNSKPNIDLSLLSTLIVDFFYRYLYDSRPQLKTLILNGSHIFLILKN